MVFKCTECGKSLKVPEEYVGRRVKCPGCQRIFAVPQLPPPSWQGASDSEINAAELASEVLEGTPKNTSESSQGRTDSPNQPAAIGRGADVRELSFPEFADTQGGRIAESLHTLGRVVVFFAVILGIVQIIIAIAIFDDVFGLWGLALLVVGVVSILAGFFINLFCKWLAYTLKYVRELWVLNVRMSNARGKTKDVVDEQ